MKGPDNFKAVKNSKGTTLLLLRKGCQMVEVSDLTKIIYSKDLLINYVRFI